MDDFLPVEPVINVDPLSAEPPPREPFWGYVDLLLIIGLGFALVVLFCLPLILFVKSEAALAQNLVILAAILQAGLYGAVYLSIRIVFRFRYGRKSVFGALAWKRTGFSLGFAGVTGVALAFVVSGIAAVLHTPQVESPIEQFTKSTGALIFIVVLAVTAAPLFEELFFRGFLQPLFSRTFGMIAGILLTAILFGALHLSEYSMVWQYGVAITLVGAALGYVRARSGSLIPSTIMHACFNSVSVVALILTKFVKHP
jgi:membrane protease YdiL (CAAX protease family)